LGGPDPRLKFLASNYFSGTFEEHRQHAKGLFLQGYAAASLMYVAGAEVNFEEPGAHTAG
jgi:hypothetical protein